MANPEVTLTIRDPGLGIVPASAGKVQVKAGACSKALPAVLLGLGGVNAAKDALGSGPLLDAVVQALDVGGGPVLALPVLVSAQGAFTNPGTPANFTLTGSGSGTIVGSFGVAQALKVKIITGGALTVMQFQVAIGSGAYGPTVTSGAGPFTYWVPGDAFTKLIFSAGTYAATDVYTVNPDGTIVRTGTGPATALATSTFSPVDSYVIQVAITTAGALGVGGFKYSLDGGKTFSAALAIPASGVYTIAGKGVVLTFAGTFTAGDIYANGTTPPGYSTGDLNTALTALLADPSSWGFIHVVGKPASAAAAATLAGIVDAAMTAAETSFRYVHAELECPQEEGDAAIKTAFLNFTSARVGVSVGDVDLFSRLTGQIDRRCGAWALTARLGAIALSKNPMAVRLGRLKNVQGLYRDESATPGLDDARFTTFRTLKGKPGYYITRFRMMAAPGSDYTFGMNRRVMDRACELARAAYLDFLGDDVRVDDAGHIDERDAQKVDGTVTAQCDEGLKDTATGRSDVSAVSTTLSRTDNLLQSSNATAEVAIRPKGYLDFIGVTIGFTNPLLQAAA